MAGTSPDTHTDISPTNAITRQLALADKVTQTTPSTVPVPAPPTSNTPPTDPAARAAFYLARAKAGDAAAQYDVGVLYARGDGLVQDYASAASWFHAAAAQGNVAAEYNLGVLYERGLGVPANADRGGQLVSQRRRPEPCRRAVQPRARLCRRARRQAGFRRRRALVPARGASRGWRRRWSIWRSSTSAATGSTARRSTPMPGTAPPASAATPTPRQRAGELFQQFNDKDKARAEGLAATIGAALDARSPDAPPA